MQPAVEDADSLKFLVFVKVALAGIFVGRGGVQTHFHWLTKALLNARCDVRIYSLGPAPQDVDRQRVRDLFGHEGSVVHIYDDGANGRRGALSAAWHFRGLLREFKPDCYIACGTGWNLFLPPLLSRSCRRLVFHEVMSGDIGGRGDSRRAVKWGFDEVIAQARPVAQAFRRTCGWTDPVAVLPAFPEPLETTAIIPARARRPVAPGQARAALFSRLVPHKQAFWLVQQWDQLKDVLSELHIFGTGPEESLIRGFIQQRGLAKQIFCHGAYPDGQAYVDLLRGFDLTLLPTIGAEGAPLVLLESMACGVPFVAFDVGGIPDYANPDCIICSVKLPGSFVASVREMVLRLSQAEVDFPRLRQFYEQRFSFAALSASWCDWVLLPSPLQSGDRSSGGGV